MIKRLTANFEIFERQFVSEPEKLEVLKAKVTDLLQSNEDLVGAVEGLVRLQKVYHLKSRDFAQGIVDGEKTRSNLTVHDCGILGRELMRLGNQDFFAIEYLQIAVENYKSFEKDEIDIVKVSFALAEVHNRTGNYKAAVAAIDALLKIDRSNQVAKDLRENLLKEFKMHGTKKFMINNPFSTDYKNKGVYHSNKEAVYFSKACRGELKNSNKVDSKLRCRLYSETPYSRIGPFKMEEASLSPVAVSLFYDVIYDSEIEQLKKLTTANLKVGTVRNGTIDIVAKSRVTKTAFVADKADKIVEKISRRVEAMTNLSCKSAEGFQVQNYGIGGHYCKFELSEHNFVAITQAAIILIQIAYCKF